MKQRFTWVVLALSLLVPSGFASGWAWFLSHGERACIPSQVASCTSFDGVDASHCHCLQSRVPAAAIHSGWTVPVLATNVVDAPRESLPPAAVGLARPRARAHAAGPPLGSPYASRTGLTLHA